MREFKIFFVVACFTALVYWGVEPYAHSVLKPHTTAANFDFAKEDLSFAQSVVLAKEKEEKLVNDELKALQNKYNNTQSLEELNEVLKPIEAEFSKLDNASEDVQKAKAAATRLLKENEALFELRNAHNKMAGAMKATQSARLSLEANQALWAEVASIDFAKGDAQRGLEVFSSSCIGCHGLKVAGFEAPINDSSLGVLPPDLSAAGLIYDEKFLAALILNPALALKVEHKFSDGNFIMSAYNADTMGEEKEVIAANIADLIAYLKEVSAQDEEAFISEIQKHLNEKYEQVQDLSQSQKMLLIKKELDFEKDKKVFLQACVRCHDMRYDGLSALSDKADLSSYLGSVPPDLSMMIRARGEEYLHNFINNTQKLLPGTAMPRVGLNEEAQIRVVSYMEKIGDSKKEQRQSLGLYIMGFFVILSIFAIAWKRKIWSKLH